MPSLGLKVRGGGSGRCPMLPKRPLLGNSSGCDRSSRLGAHAESHSLILRSQSSSSLHKLSSSSSENKTLMLYCALPDALEVARLHPCKSY
jgi:hypothetical protein